jgi:hypothetical protein
MLKILKRKLVIIGLLIVVDIVGIDTSSYDA